MSHTLRRFSARAGAVGAVVLAGLLSAGTVGAQVQTPDVFRIDRYVNVHAGLVPERTVRSDDTVRITNPNNTGLRAWGSHTEFSGGVSTTETSFQAATLSAAEFGRLTDLCTDIFENGSGHGQCTCRPEKDRNPWSKDPPVVEPGTLCANIYVFTADQQMAECCACAVTPNGLVTLSVPNDLTDNPLTPASPERGVIKLLSSLPGPMNDCDPTAPTLATPPADPPANLNPQDPGGGGTGNGPSATEPTGHTNAAGLACDVSSISPSLQRKVVKRVNALRSRLQAAAQRGPRALERMRNRTNATLRVVQRALAKAVKRGHVSGPCQTLMQAQITDLRGQVNALGN